MAEHILRYAMMVFMVLMGAWDISGAAKGFVEGKYFGAGVYSMMTIWMICLFVRVFFEF